MQLGGIIKPVDVYAETETEMTSNFIMKVSVSVKHINIVHYYISIRKPGIFTFHYFLTNHKIY